MKTKTNKSNILFVTNCYPLITLTFITNQISGLLDSGYEVRIISLQKPDKTTLQICNLNPEIQRRIIYLENYKKGKVKMLFRTLLFCIKHPGNAWVTINNFFRLKAFPFELALLFIKLDKKVKLIHAHFGPSGVEVLKWINNNFFVKAAFITTFHGYDLKKEDFPNRYFDELFHRCFFFTVNSGYSKQLLSDLKCSSERIHILPVGLDTSFFSKIDNDSEDSICRLIYVGRLTPLKGPDRAIEIFRVLHSKYPGKFRLTLVGEGEQFDELASLIKKNELQEYVNLTRAQSQSEIVKLLDKSDIFLFPGKPYQGKEETQGLVIQEAQSMKLPVVTSDVGGIKYGLINGETGFVIDWQKLNEFVVTIENLYNNLNLRKQMGLNGRKFVQENFDTRILNKKLLSIYAMALDHQHKYK